MNSRIREYVETFIPALKEKVGLLTLLLFLIAIDQSVKQWTFHALPLISYTDGYPYGGIGIFKEFFGVEFSLVHATNKGAAWSLFSDYALSLLWLRILFILALGIFLLRDKFSKAQFPWILILSGAISNVIDHFVHGHVIDTFHFILWGYDYPVFNIADSLIFCGALILITGGFSRERVSKN